jgi:hypothetical protein
MRKVVGSTWMLPRFAASFVRLRITADCALTLRVLLDADTERWPDRHAWVNSAERIRDAVDDTEATVRA